MRRKLTPRGEKRRVQLMRHAARLFAQQGYHPTSVADIVASLGVGKGVFYWYFSSKEELLAEMLADSYQDLRRCQQHAIGDTPDPVVRIELGIRASIAWFAEHRDHFAISRLAATDERFAPLVRRNQEAVIADAARHIKEAIVEGRAADRDPEMLAQAIVGVVEQLVQTYLFKRHEPADEVAETAVSFCLRGLSD